MIIGVLFYYVIHALPISAQAEDGLYHFLSRTVQPVLIFTMLLLSFLKVNPHDLRPHRWHGVLLFTQGMCMVLCALIANLPQMSPANKVIAEGAMLCFICPTATASAVIVQKLGGSLSGCVSYLILCNLMVALLAPSLLSYVEPHPSLSVFDGAALIMGKVFPLLLCPLFLALIIRRFAPRLMQAMLRIRDLAFYLWLIALPLAITVTVLTLVESDIAAYPLLGMALVSLLCCIIQFVLGRYIGGRFSTSSRDGLTAGQAFGQKNTVFIIWLGLVFLNPVTSVVGGFYSVWHNVINSWQLYKKEKQQ